MALRDELEPKTEKLIALIEWVQAQPNVDEWHELLMDTDYSGTALSKLLHKHGHAQANPNTIYRYRARHAS